MSPPDIEYTATTVFFPLENILATRFKKSIFGKSISLVLFWRISIENNVLLALNKLLGEYEKNNYTTPGRLNEVITTRAGSSSFFCPTFPYTFSSNCFVNTTKWAFLRLRYDYSTKTRELFQTIFLTEATVLLVFKGQ